MVRVLSKYFVHYIMHYFNFHRVPVIIAMPASVCLDISTIKQHVIRMTRILVQSQGRHYR